MSEISEPSIHESFKVNWFPPDRPVEGNTIYVIPRNEKDANGDAAEAPE
jgi:hypothetical protein